MEKTLFWAALIYVEIIFVIIAIWAAEEVSPRFLMLPLEWDCFLKSKFSRGENKC